MLSDYESGYLRSNKTILRTAEEEHVCARSWTMEMKGEVHNIGLAFVWAKQQECNLKEITKTLKDYLI
jgi:hypothetical protein